MALDRDSKAAEGIGALRRRLAEASPDFAAASAEEAWIDQFCAYVRRQLQEHRERQGLLQGDVAQRLGLTQSAISKIESGRGDLGLRTVARYARALGLRPNLTFSPDREQDRSSSWKRERDRSYDAPR